MWLLYTAKCMATEEVLSSKPPAVFRQPCRRASTPKKNKMKGAITHPESIHTCLQKRACFITGNEMNTKL